MENARVWKEEILIPTYEVGEADKNPMFLEKRTYQGSSGKIYPYPTTQKISREKTDHKYQAVFLENEYIKVEVLPELGGRIERATDKTNGYEFVYYNHVIKPALVGLLGPWISGGIEFNWPQHHRPTTYAPVRYRIHQDLDGTASVDLYDTDRMYGTDVVTTFTLYPGRSYIEIKARLYNPTGLPQTFLWWANPAVAVNDDTQSVFPPDVQNVYDHGKRAVSRFPIATGEYYKHDYSAGVDISRYKNIPVPTSYMAEKSKYDFMGGYDYGKKAGLLHVADHHVSPGKKQWTWGCGDFGKAWDRNLTDEDGPYVELMTGMYCDNQPDFSWLKPHEEKTFTQYFMPYRNAGYVKNATKECAVNIEKTEDGLYAAVYATGRVDAAKIIIKNRASVCFTEAAALAPDKPFEKIFALSDFDIHDISISVEADGKTLVSYETEPENQRPQAKPADALKKPEDIITTEELYLAGQHLEQYRHATIRPDAYYLEALKRDPDDVRNSNAYGLLLLRRGCFEKAVTYFDRAIKRLTSLTPNPYNSEAFFNKGLALFYQKKYEEAYDSFYKAIWTEEEKEGGYYYLSCIAAMKGKWEEALSFADKSLVRNAHNRKCRGLKAMLFYKLGRADEAKVFAEESLTLGGFDFVSLYVLEKLGRETLLDERSGDKPYLLLSASSDLAEAGFYEEAIEVLSHVKSEIPQTRYQRGTFLLALGQKDKALAEFKAAEEMVPGTDYPNRLEDIGNLQAAMEENPEGAKAPYYLGCLFYDKFQYDEAIALWEKAAELDSSYPTVWRNLAIGYFNKQGKKEKALSCMKKAFKLSEKDQTVFLEYDQLKKKMGVSKADRLAFYESHKDLMADRDDIYAEYVTVLNLNGKYKEAYDAIMAHEFRAWEGAEGKISTQFKTALCGFGKEAFAKGDYDKAANLFKEAVSYPLNLGEGRLEGTKDNNIYFYLGLCREKAGDRKGAEEYFRLATLGASDPAGPMYYYDQPADMIMFQGLAFEKLGNTNEANARFYKLIDYGQNHMEDVNEPDYFAVSMPEFLIFDEDMDKKNRAHCHYLLGLGALGLGDKVTAAGEFEKALEEDPFHQGAAGYLADCR